MLPPVRACVSRCARISPNNSSPEGNGVDLKHTFGRRLRAARVPFETRQVLLGHTNGSITTPYSAAEIGELIEGVRRIDASRSTPVLTTLRVPSVKVAAKPNATAEALQSVAAKNLGHAKVA